jgi:MoxR-like ATPase
MSAKFYTGKKFLKKSHSDKMGIDPYIPSASLVEAVKLAQILQRPLLVKGEPGCGKSRLAQAVAAELHGKKFNDFYFEWNVKSTSKAVDGLYSINNLQRLSDANIRTENTSDKKNSSSNIDLTIRLVHDKNGVYNTKGKYVELGELGKAFQQSFTKNLAAPPVVLIDEIDKADIDFPNDLLLELDRMEFTIPEARNENNKAVTIAANKTMRPVIIITSNDEKALPGAFLRRCLFHFIDFKEIQLEQIVESKFPSLAKEKGLIKKAVNAFRGWRKKIEEKGTSNKLISTGELLNWVELVDHYIKLKTFKYDLNENTLPPYHQALLKDVESIQAFAETK